MKKSIQLQNPISAIKIVLLCIIFFIGFSSTVLANPGGTSPGNIMPNRDCSGCHWENRPSWQASPTFELNVDEPLSTQEIEIQLSETVNPQIYINSSNSRITSRSTFTVDAFSSGGDGPVNGYFICTLQLDENEIVNPIDPVRYDEFFERVISVREAGFEILQNEETVNLSYLQKATNVDSDNTAWTLRTPEVTENTTYYIFVVFYYGTNPDVEEVSSIENAGIKVSNILEIEVLPNTLYLASQDLNMASDDVDQSIVPIWRFNFIIKNHFYYGLIGWFLFTIALLLHISMPFYKRERLKLNNKLSKDLIWSAFLIVRELSLLATITIGTIIILNPSWILWQTLLGSTFKVYSFLMIIGIGMLYLVMLVKIFDWKSKRNILQIINFILIMIAFTLYTIGIFEVSTGSDIFANIIQ